MDDQQKPILNYASPAADAELGPNWRDWRTAPIGLSSVCVCQLAAVLFIIVAATPLGSFSLVQGIAALGTVVAFLGFWLDRLRYFSCMGFLGNAVVLFIVTFR